MKTRSGFTLIELMIVVAIIAIIAGIAIPNLLRTRMSANEGGAVAAVRTISTAEVSYQLSAIDATADGVGKFGSLPALGAGTVPYINTVLAAGIKTGYSFETIPTMDGTIPQYTATAIPLQSGRTGLRTYFVDESGVIRFDGTGASPSSASPPLN